MIIALLLAGFLVHRVATRETHVTLLALIAVCAVQSVIVALVQYYGVTAIRPLQPVMATIIPPVAWIAFSRAAGGDAQRGTLAWHAIPPVLAVLFLSTSSALLDVLIPLSFAGYGAAMLLRLGQGEDSLPHSGLQGGAMPLLAWRIIALSLIASAASDVVIAYYLSVGEDGVLNWIPSLVSSLSLLGLGAVGLSHATESHRDEEAGTDGPSNADLERDQAIIARLDAYVASHRPFTDPDLTLARLSRKLSLPAKQLSAAINRLKAENVSRYINRQRIEEACRRLAEGHSVTNAMLDSGFNTKSNFNREFLRVKGVNPSTWMQQQKTLLNRPTELSNSVI